MADRGVTPVVGKALELTIVVFYISIVAGVMYGGVVPAARSASEDISGERIAVNAAHAIEDAVPATGTNVSVREQVQLPATIRGVAYTIHVDNETLVLSHPDPGVSTRIPITVEDPIVGVQGQWNGTGHEVIRIESADGGWVIILETMP